MTIVVVTLTLDSQIGTIADMIPEQVASSAGYRYIRCHLGDICNNAVLYPRLYQEN